MGLMHPPFFCMILLCSISCSVDYGGDGGDDDSFIQSSDGEEKQERKLNRIDTDISTQIKDQLQVTMLVLIYDDLLLPLLFCLLERSGGLFPSLLADYKDLDVDNSHVPYQAYLPLLESS